MLLRFRLLPLCGLGSALWAASATLPLMASEPAPKSELPVKDARATVPPRNLDTHRTFPTFSTKEHWETHRDALRLHIQNALGLYPMPARTPLQTRVSDRVERDGYTIEKVSFQTYPGFYLAGNLYRPFKNEKFRLTATPEAKHPGVLVAHGHWENGRMANTELGSIAARAITFARQGYVAFTYDMVGYNDTRQFPNHRAIFDTPRHWLWGVSLMGLQTWNSSRALDFLISLPDVDAKRLAITGESGGGTQTMMLSALDERLAAAAPCVMVSHTMQGGCLCENAPGLRVDASNVEVSALFAPKPQIIVGASGDWTATTLTMEGPAIAGIYDLYGKPNAFRAVRFDYPHNINKMSREAVDTFFAQKLLGQPADKKITEPPYTMETPADLRVFPANKPLPNDTKTAEQLFSDLQKMATDAVETRKPKDKATLTAFQTIFLPMWKHTLNIEMSSGTQIVTDGQKMTEEAGYKAQTVHFGRDGKGDNISGLLFLPLNNPTFSAVVLAHPQGKGAYLDKDGKPNVLVRELLSHKQAILLVDLFQTGESFDRKVLDARHVPFGVFFSTYNRTNAQERVQDLLTAAAYLRSRGDVRTVTFCGQGAMGIYALLAAPDADAVIADMGALDLSKDDTWLSDDLFVPGVRRLGDVRTCLTLAAPKPVFLYNVGKDAPDVQWVRDVYTATKNDATFRTMSTVPTDDTLAAWAQTQK